MTQLVGIVYTLEELSYHPQERWTGWRNGLRGISWSSSKVSYNKEILLSHHKREMSNPATEEDKPYASGWV